MRAKVKLQNLNSELQLCFCIRINFIFLKLFDSAVEEEENEEIEEEAPKDEAEIEASVNSKSSRLVQNFVCFNMVMNDMVMNDTIVFLYAVFLLEHLWFMKLNLNLITSVMVVAPLFQLNYIYNIHRTCVLPVNAILVSRWIPSTNFGYDSPCPKPLGPRNKLAAMPP
ncbi:hypothetical protein L6452_05384 [Arctium lappa]|uniref:Uncharacterized protein n=1 Tax=Arctium lappa TaxID=4217 RepID=A0ACB9EHB4_ARCLA|nr:hypothetical protein L6452_05384 [Arctium lappa]